MAAHSEEDCRRRVWERRAVAPRGIECSICLQAGEEKQNQVRIAATFYIFFYSIRI
jgi:hypothetical protein